MTFRDIMRTVLPEDCVHNLAEHLRVTMRRRLTAGLGWMIRDRIKLLATEGMPPTATVEEMMLCAWAVPNVRLAPIGTGY